MANNRSVLWTDAGARATITLIRTLTGGATIQSDVEALSNAGVLNEWDGTLTVTTPSTSSAQYPSVTQQATLVFLCADGTTARIDIPAPALSIFLSDGVTVDATTIGILIADCIGNLLSTTLSPATAYLSGILNKRS